MKSCSKVKCKFHKLVLSVLLSCSGDYKTALKESDKVFDHGEVTTLISTSVRPLITENI